MGTWCAEHKKAIGIGIGIGILIVVLGVGAFYALPAIIAVVNTSAPSLLGFSSGTILSSTFGALGTGFLYANSEQTNNFFNGRGWRTHKEVEGVKSKEAQSSKAKSLESASNQASYTAPNKAQEEISQEIDEEIQKEAEPQANEARNTPEEDKNKTNVANNSDETACSTPIKQQEYPLDNSGEEVEAMLSSDSSKEPLLLNTQQSGKSKSSLGNKLYQGLDDLITKLSSYLQGKGPASKQAEVIKACTQKAQIILDKLEENGIASNWQVQASELVSEIAQLAKEAGMAHTINNNLSAYEGLSQKLQQYLFNRLWELTDHITTLEKTKTTLQEKAGLNKKPEGASMQFTNSNNSPSKSNADLSLPSETYSKQQGEEERLRKAAEEAANKK